MKIIIQEPSFKTTAQIALEDEVFSELFGEIWINNGYTIKSKEDLSWAILYKDMLLQALSDYVNEGFIKIKKNQKFFIHESAKSWMEKESPFDNEKILQKFKNELNKIKKIFFENKNHSNAEKQIFDNKFEKIFSSIKYIDLFNFNKCCEVLGLDSEITRQYFKLYKKLKIQYGNNIRIVNYTGKKKNLNIPSLSDIIKGEDADGKQNLSLFLHIGISRKLRNKAIVRSRKREGSS